MGFMGSWDIRLQRLRAKALDTLNPIGALVGHFAAGSLETWPGVGKLSLARARAGEGPQPPLFCPGPTRLHGNGSRRQHLPSARLSYPVEPGPDSCAAGLFYGKYRNRTSSICDILLPGPFWANL